MGKSFYQLPLTYDLDRLMGDLSAIQDSDWIPHFGINYEDGWSGVSLKSTDGSASSLEPGSEYLDTPILERCPYFREILNSFQAPLKRCRLLKLSAGSVIKEHIDPGTGECQSVVRLHIPIVTSPQVSFYSNGKRVIMEPGYLYFVDTSYPHAVFNASTIDRVHLVIDCEANDWVRSLMPGYFSHANWKRLLSYKFRVVRFMLRDLWVLKNDIHSKEFHRRLWILRNEINFFKKA